MGLIPARLGFVIMAHASGEAAVGWGGWVGLLGLIVVVVVVVVVVV